MNTSGVKINNLFNSQTNSAKTGWNITTKKESEKTKTSSNTVNKEKK